jgi:capsular exopolysaccharide synthesis family protein
MIENSARNQRNRQMARRRGVSPSQSLRPHFLALARQVSQWSQLQEEHRVGKGFAIGVTSLNKGAGKSTVSFNLAAALTTAARSKVMLVESDFGSPYVSRRMGLTKSSGFSEVLRCDAELKDSIHQTPVDNLAIIGCGRGSEQESIELPFDMVPSIIDEKTNDFGYLIFDLPIASNLTACHSLTPHLDGIILTVESNQLDQRAIQRFNQKVRQQGGDIIGVVINKA